MVSSPQSARAQTTRSGRLHRRRLFAGCLDPAGWLLLASLPRTHHDARIPTTPIPSQRQAAGIADLIGAGASRCRLPASSRSVRRAGPTRNERRTPRLAPSSAALRTSPGQLAWTSAPLRRSAASIDCGGTRSHAHGGHHGAEAQRSGPFAPTRVRVNPPSQLSTRAAPTRRKRRTCRTSTPRGPWRRRWRLAAAPGGSAAASATARRRPR